MGSGRRRHMGPLRDVAKETRAGRKETDRAPPKDDQTAIVSLFAVRHIPENSSHATPNIDQTSEVRGFTEGTSRGTKEAIGLLHSAVQSRPVRAFASAASKTEKGVIRYADPHDFILFVDHKMDQWLLDEREFLQQQKRSFLHRHSRDRFDNPFDTVMRELESYIALTRSCCYLPPPYFLPNLLIAIKERRHQERFKDTWIRGNWRAWYSPCDWRKPVGHQSVDIAQLHGEQVHPMHSTWSCSNPEHLDAPYFHLCDDTELVYRDWYVRDRFCRTCQSMIQVSGWRVHLKTIKHRTNLIECMAPHLPYVPLDIWIVLLGFVGPISKRRIPAKRQVTNSSKIGSVRCV